jgi:hypothetical protein
MQLFNLSWSIGIQGIYKEVPHITTLSVHPKLEYLRGSFQRLLQQLLFLLLGLSTKLYQT